MIPDTQSALIKVMDNVDVRAALVQAEIAKRAEFARRSIGQRVRYLNRRQP